MHDYINFQGILNRPPGWGRLAQNPKKILNRRNEVKDLLKTRDLAFSGPENELLFECQKRQSKRKMGQDSTSCGAENQVPGVRFGSVRDEAAIRMQNGGD